MKTIEVASLENSKKHYIMAFSEDLHKDADMDFRAGVEFAQRWISVEEELPKNDDPILMKTKEDGVVFGKFKNIALIWSVTHWRPIELK